MSIYKILSTGNQIVADAAFMEAHYAGNYAEVTAPQLPAEKARYTIAQFIEALTRPEALNFLATMKTDPLLEMWYELAKARGGVDFNDADTYDNAPYLVQAGVLTQERLDAITG